MGDYRPDTCGYCQADTWCETRANGRPQCRACKVERFFSEILYKPIGFTLLPWQRKAIRDIYGTVDAVGDRQYRRAFLSVAKKNGKSFLVGGLPIYHLLMEVEREPRAYGCAAARDQGGLVFDAALSLIRKNPMLMDRLKVLDSTKRILRRDGGGVYQVISADGDLQDGVEPSLAIIDELHRWKTAKASTLYDVITKGIISRREPLIIEITTAGDVNDSPIWLREANLARRKLEGSLNLDSFYAAVWAADEQRLSSPNEADSEYWMSREARVAANPSHEDLGGFLKDSAIVEEMNKAVEDPSERPKYFRYHLNVSVNASEQRAVDMMVWAHGHGGVDLDRWPDYDVDLLISKWGLTDRECYIGVDASWTTDLSAVSMLFPGLDDSDPWRMMLFYFMPGKTIREREKRDHVPYASWAQKGFVSASKTDHVDTREIQERIRWGCRMFAVREIDFDKTNFTREADELAEEGLPVVRVEQSYRMLSEPTKKFLELVVGRNVWHGNNPVTNFCVASLTLGYRGDEVLPEKPARQKSSKRIDGVSATVTAMARVIAHRQVSASAYEGQSEVLI